jgi:hypothetical protein
MPGQRREASYGWIEIRLHAAGGRQRADELPAECGNVVDDAAPDQGPARVALAALPIVVDKATGAITLRG